MTITQIQSQGLGYDPALLMTATIVTDDFAVTDEDDGHTECDHTNNIYRCDSC